MAKGFASQPDRPLSNGRMKVASVTSATALTEQFQDYFGELEDLESSALEHNLLIDIIVMAILAVIAGAKGWEDIENYAISKLVGGVRHCRMVSLVMIRFVACRAAQSTSFERCFQRCGSPGRVRCSRFRLMVKPLKGHMIEKRSALPCM